MNRDPYESGHHRLHRDSERGIILGVCAGVAERLDCPPWLVRVAALVLGWFFTVPTIIAYVVAAFLMPERPLRYRGCDDERSFWQSRKHRS